MKNRLSLLLVAGAIAMPALADAPKSEWSLYGTLVTELNNTKVSGSNTAAYDLASRNRFTCSTSNVGLKGSMQATPDIKVIWQLESSVGIDGDAPSTWAGRNTALGLETKFGTVLAGSWDTPYKDVVMKMGPVPASLVSDVSIITTPGFRTIGTVTATKPAGNSGDAIFNRRQGNSIQYWSPAFQGFQAKLMYSMNEGKAANSAAVQTNPTLLSGTVSYNNKALGLTVIYAFEQHNDYFGLSQMNLGQTLAATASSNETVLGKGGVNSKDTGNMLAVYWALPTKTRICAVVEQLKYTTDNPTNASAPVGNTVPANAATGNLAAAEYKRTAWYVIASQEIDAHKVWAGFGMAGKGTLKDESGAKVAGEFGAKQYTLGYAYSLTKGVSLYANIYGVINDENATYSPMPPVAGGAAGASGTIGQNGDTRGFGGGLLYKF
ncbi:porin [Holophaga foetida]|uniref:porin n=1 Tax=Holophaga foetida TaxID=35839 RepID=UPI0002474CAF|nr:porin [Holophaga foetida]